MANRNIGVHVTGIPEFTAALKAVNPEAYKQLRKDFQGIAKYVIRRAEGLGAPAGVLRASATQKGAGIRFPKGGPEAHMDPVGYYPWLDFGGAPRPGRGVTSSTGASHERSDSQEFRRALVPGGRYLYPAVAQSRDFIADTAYQAIEKAARSKGFEVRG